MNRIFIGVDERQPLAFNVLQHAIQTTALRPTEVIPLYKHQLPIKRFGLTDFTFSRYLVPYLCDFDGRALFMDGDMLVLQDINGLFDWHDDYCDKHHGTPAVMVQQELPRFEWPSMMLFDCGQCEHLTPEFINDPTNNPQELSQWAKGIGAIPPEWNVMVRASEPEPIPEDAKVLHYTEGLPCFFETQHTPGARQWQQAAKEMGYTVPWKELMGGSIHAKPVLQALLGRYAA